MGLGHSTRIVTDGLVLSLDAQNSKSWKSGTTWTDTFGGNNGTLTGGTSHSDGPFPEAGYVEFDGSTEYLSIADSADLEIDTNTTIELFIKFKTIPTVATYIFGKQNGYWLAYDSTAVGGVADRFTFSIYNGSSWSGTTNASGGFLPVVDTWYHIAIVKEGTSTKLYVDGTLYGSGTFSGTPADNSNAVHMPWSGTLIHGEISNVRFIKGTALYTSDFTPPSSPLTAVTNTKLLCCQGGTNVDASPSAHSFQVIIGVPTLTSVGPSATKYFEFDGGNDYISVSNSSSLNPLNNTLICWAKSDNSTWNDYGFLMSKRDVFVMHPSQGTKTVNYYYYLNGSWQNQDVTPSDITIWNMYACTWDGTSISAYLNGSLINSGTKTGPLNTSDTGSMFIGRDDGIARYMDGNIAQVFMYNRALTASEVQQNYNAFKGRYV